MCQYEHDSNVVEKALELMEVQQTQEEYYLSAEEMSGYEVDYMTEFDNIEKHPDTISMDT